MCVPHGNISLHGMNYSAIDMAIQSKEKQIFPLPLLLSIQYQKPCCKHRPGISSQVLLYHAPGSRRTSPPIHRAVQVVITWAVQAVITWAVQVVIITTHRWQARLGSHRYQRRRWQQRNWGQGLLDLLWWPQPHISVEKGT